MATEPEGNNEKDQKDPFAYSWYLPVTGGKPPTGAEPTEQPPQPESKGQMEGGAESDESPSEPTPFQDSADSGPREALGPRFKVSPSLLRVVGLSAWSIVSGVGIIALLVTQNPFQLTPVLGVVGLWAVVSGLIWFLPGKISN
jgi:hypothetical protein